MTDGGSALLGRGAGAFLPPLFRRVREELARRGAGDLQASNPASIDNELNEAIQVLLGEADTLPDHILGWIKGRLSDPPSIFADAEARDWLRRDDVRALLKRSALALVAGADLTAEIEEAKRLYAVSSDDGAWLGEPLFVYGVSFLALTLKAKVSSDTRLILSAANVHAEQSAALLERIETKLDGVAVAVRTASTTAEITAEGRWLPVAFGSDRGIAPALLGEMLGPADVAACPRLIEADTLLAQLEAVGAARIAGVPGAGKSISMLQVANQIAGRGWRVVRLDDANASLPPLIASNQPVLHLIDDAHLANPVHVRRLEEGCGPSTWLLSAHTIAPGKVAARGTVHLDAVRAVKTIANGLEADYGRTFEAVRRLDDRIGASMGDERLEDRLRAAATADVPWQFCFILSGGWRRATAFAASARSAGADLTLAALAIRQLAARDAHFAPEEAHVLLDGIVEDQRIASAIDWLLAQRLLLRPDDLRCPHQRFGSVLIDQVLTGVEAEERQRFRLVLQRVLSNPSLPLAGLATLIHDLRYAHAGNRYRGWSSMVDPDWLEPGLARCWSAQSPIEIRDAAWFLSEIGGIHPNEKALFAAHQSTISDWIATCPTGACYALGNLANHILNIDEALGTAIRYRIDSAVFTRNIDAGDARRTAEVIALASKLRLHWDKSAGRAAFLQALDRPALSRLMAEWPASLPLSYAAEISKFMVYADEAYGLEITEALSGAIGAPIAADPIDAFHELNDVISHSLRLLDVLGIYVGKRAPNRRRKAIGRKYAAVFAKASLAASISSAKKRDYQSCAMLLSFLQDIAHETFCTVVRAIDWDAVSRTIGDDWSGGGGDGEVLLGVAFGDPQIRPVLKDLIAPHLPSMRVMAARLALMFPDLAIEQLNAGRLVGFDHRWEWGALITGHVAAVRPNLLDRLLQTNLKELADSLSQQHPNYLHEKLLLIRIIADVTPDAFDRLLSLIEPASAAIGWRKALRGIQNEYERDAQSNARALAAFLVEHALRKQDAVGAMARELRRSFPRASVPDVKTLESPGPYAAMNHSNA
ncbi:hypothetical protein [Sphingomonas pokkalii]|uniref:hypothetical protein n=1 Tax=Sphingomonas pokkalii TaxID=2175090 RepID=UPI0010576577|nr:hypothetical protein [Sphingomonas pokkalii]